MQMADFYISIIQKASTLLKQFTFIVTVLRKYQKRHQNVFRRARTFFFFLFYSLMYPKCLEQCLAYCRGQSHFLNVAVSVKVCNILHFDNQTTFFYFLSIFSIQLQLYLDKAKENSSDIEFKTADLAQRAVSPHHQMLRMIENIFRS